MGPTYRFYNPGTRRFEGLPYDKPPERKEDGDVGGRFAMDAPESGFFELPVLIELPNGNQIQTHFDKTVIRSHGRIGMMIVDAVKEPHEGNNYARTDKDAKTKGDAWYTDYCMSILQDHMDNAELLKSKGLRVPPATNFVKHLLKKFNIPDPGTLVTNMVEHRTENEEIASLKRQMAELLKRMPTSA